MNKFLSAVLLLFSVSLLKLNGVEITDFKNSNFNWDHSLSVARQKSKSVHFSPGIYEFKQTITVDDDLVMQFDDGVILKSAANPVFKHKGGILLLESSGRQAILIGSEQNSMFDLNNAGSGKTAVRLIIRNISIQAFTGIDCSNRDKSATVIGLIDISNSSFDCKFKCVGIKTPELGECRITSSNFKNAKKVIQIDSSIPGGVYICGNTLRNFGNVGIQVGRAMQVADGCTRYLPNAIIHENRLLSGGSDSLKDVYIHGILVYGNTVSVQGNIIRDVNRGKRVPGEKMGHQIITATGEILRGKTQIVAGKKSRLAGAAIYLKANRAIVQGNVCTNSGWRSVIEIKTGGKEYYSSIINNVVDGTALAIDESYAFECHSGRSIWANNTVHNAPHQAFVVRSGFENTFVNNVISDSKIGFALAGKNPGQDELISGNRFINVKFPVAVDGMNPQEIIVPEIAVAGNGCISESEELPEPSNQWYGRMLTRGSRVYIGIKNKNQYQWKELRGNLVPFKQYAVTGKELLFNADQSGKGVAPSKDLADSMFPGWIAVGMTTASEKKIDPHCGCITFDTVKTISGGRSLKIMFPDTSGQWKLRQPVKLVPGRRYRASAVVCGEEPRNLRLEIELKNRSHIVRANDTKEWQTLSVDFQMPKGEKKIFFSIRSAKTSPKKASWIDSVSLREISEINSQKQ